MNSFIKFLAISATAASANTLSRHEKRDSCGQWDTISASPYTLYNDLWNEASGTGWGCIGLDYQSGSQISWHAVWTWSGDSSAVKSYPNAILADYTPLQLSSVTSIPTTWEWSYTGTEVVADVSYDMFTSSTSSGSAEFEIMVWLAALGEAGPISSTGSAIATPTIGGTTWDLYSGPNGDTTVYSFVASSEVTSFSADLLEFYTYLVSNEGFSTSQYIQSVGAGTEPFTGTDGQLTTTLYTVSIN